MMRLEDTRSEYLGRAVRCCERYHDGQLDRASGHPYSNHCRRVMMGVWLDHTDIPDYVLIAALFHDVLEDTQFTADDIRGEFKDFEDIEKSIEIVELLTRDPEQITYKNYIKRLVDSGNLYAIYIKLADIADNLDPARGNMLPAQEIESLVARYQAARLELEATASKLEAEVREDSKAA